MDYINDLLFSEEISLEKKALLLEENIKDKQKINSIIFPNKIKNTIINENIYNDLEFINSRDNNKNSVLDTLCQETITPYSYYTTQCILKTPHKDNKKIKERQEIIKYFVKNKNKTDEIRKLLSSYKNLEDIFWLWKSDDENSDLLQELVYYDFPYIKDYLNGSETLLNITSLNRIFLSPAFTLLTPITCFIVPFIMMRYVGLKVSFYDVFNLLKHSVFSVSFIPRKTKFLAILSTLFWIGMYGYSVYSIFKISSLTNNVINIIHKKLQIANSIVELSKKIKNILNNIPEYFKNHFEIKDSDIELEELISSDNIRKDPSLLSNKGNILSSYWKVRKILTGLSNNIRFIGYVDSYTSLVCFINKLKNKNLPWAYSSFNSNKKSYKKFWHISLINKTSPVKNSLRFNNKTNTLIITGPNAAGKSTIIKTIFINNILSQTFGIAFAKEWNNTIPFNYMETYFKIQDVQGKFSGFEAEVEKCNNIIKQLDKLKLKKKCNAMIALDEIFTSTNYQEGISGSYSIIKNISQNYPNVLCLITTHYHELKNLEKDTKGKVKNYCLETNKDKNGKLLKNTYKLKKGVCESHIALDLLEKKGLSDKIIKTAKNKYMRFSKDT